MEEEDDIFFYKTNISLEEYKDVLTKYTNRFNINEKEKYLKKMKTKKVLEGYEYMELPLSFIENRWIHSLYYISNNIENIKQKEKYIYSRRDLIQCEIHEPPMIEIINSFEIEIINGRNRFANMRDLGYTIIPVWIKKEDISLLSLMLED